MGSLMKTIASGVGLAAEAIASHKEKSRLQSHAKPSTQSPPYSQQGFRDEPPSYDDAVSPSTHSRSATPAEKPPRSREKSPATEDHLYRSDDPDETAWALDETVPETSSAEHSTKQKSHLGLDAQPTLSSLADIVMAACATPLHPAQPLPLPVIIPQRRPGNKDRGFVRAYAPSLAPAGISEETFLLFLTTFHTAAKASPVLNVVMLGSAVAGFMPSIAANVTGMVVGAAARMAAESQKQGRRKGFLEVMNERLFEPRGLLAVVVMIGEDGQEEGQVGAGGVKGVMMDLGKRRLTTGRGSGGEVELMDSAPLIFPQSELGGEMVEGQGEGEGESKLKRSWRFVGDYYDQRARAAYASEHPGSKMVPMGMEPSFKSKLSDPNHPAFQGGLLTLATGGLIPGRGNSGREERREGNGMEREGCRGRDGPSRRPGGPIGMLKEKKRKMKAGMLYLMIVNLPSEEEMAAARGALEEAERKAKGRGGWGGRITLEKSNSNVSQPFCDRPAPPGSTLIHEEVGFTFFGWWKPLTSTVCIDIFDVAYQIRVGQFKRDNFTREQSPFDVDYEDLPAYDVNILYSVVFSHLKASYFLRVSIHGVIAGQRVAHTFTVYEDKPNSVSSTPSNGAEVNFSAPTHEELLKRSASASGWGLALSARHVANANDARSVSNVCSEGFRGSTPFDLNCNRLKIIGYWHPQSTRLCFDVCTNDGTQIAHNLIDNFSWGGEQPIIYWTVPDYRIRLGFYFKSEAEAAEAFHVDFDGTIYGEHVVNNWFIKRSAILPSSINPMLLAVPDPPGVATSRRSTELSTEAKTKRDSNTASANGIDTAQNRDCGQGPEGSTAINENRFQGRMTMTGYWHPPTSFLCVDFWDSARRKLVQYGSNRFNFNHGGQYSVRIYRGVYRISADMWFQRPQDVNQGFIMGLNGYINGAFYNDHWTISRSSEASLSATSSGLASPLGSQAPSTSNYTGGIILTTFNGTNGTMANSGACGSGPEGSTPIDTNYGFRLKGYWSPTSTTLCLDASDDSEPNIGHFETNKFDFAGTPFIPSVHEKGYEVDLRFWFAQPTEVNQIFHASLVGIIRGDKVAFNWEIQRNEGVLTAVDSGIATSRRRRNLQLYTGAEATANQGSNVTVGIPKECGAGWPGSIQFESNDLGFKLNGFWHIRRHTLCIDASDLETQRWLFKRWNEDFGTNGPRGRRDAFFYTDLKTPPDYHLQITIFFKSSQDLGQRFNVFVQGTVRGLAQIHEVTINSDGTVEPQMAETENIDSAAISIS
ncbi:uncharacterized protein KY384_006341 [Bacidia gigantensis]|uniref:uncharacterized protein n=1 Tax=Bacidia gigantensis TaxID=2732470 RepID=UPI001D03A0A0|nr:uncharacterized protein KY384_006341 [Bacidia gigantensis]KAG8528654.1 hypothetical protein KY384_006341 [Bacidia gigantensis]